MITLSAKRGERLLSVEETLVKQEKDLELARNSIKNLQSNLGTVILSDDSESDGVISTGDEDVEVEIEQKDAFFGHDYTYKTNVRKLEYF